MEQYQLFMAVHESIKLLLIGNRTTSMEHYPKESLIRLTNTTLMTHMWKQICSSRYAYSSDWWYTAIAALFFSTSQPVFSIAGTLLANWIAY